MEPGAIAAYVFTFTAVVSSIYAAVTASDERCLLALTVAIASLAMEMMCVGAVAAAALQLSLAAGFAAAAGFLLPRLRGPHVAGWAGVGAVAALIIAAALGVRSPAAPKEPVVDEWSSILLMIASLPLLAGLLAIRVAFRGG